MRRLSALVFPGFEPLDLYGPLEMFGLMPEDFSISVVSADPSPVPSARGISAHADSDLTAGADCNLLLVPGGPGVREAIRNQDLLDWIARTSKSAELTMSVCTGSLLLARAGVLKCRSATTNKAAFGWVAEQEPAVKWVPQARWVEDGDIFTSSGVSAGMDMALAIVRHLHGHPAAAEIAKIVEYTWQDDPNIDPFAGVHGLV